MKTRAEIEAKKKKLIDGMRKDWYGKRPLISDELAEFKGKKR